MREKNIIFMSSLVQHFVLIYVLFHKEYNETILGYNSWCLDIVAIMFYLFQLLKAFCVYRNQKLTTLKNTLSVLCL
jgi:hypothetical protein